MNRSGVSFALLREAVRDGRSDEEVVALEVGASAARFGIPLHEVMDHVERAFAGQPPRFGTVRAAALAWADTALLHHADIGCEDPLTSLATVPHVRSRLGDIYRGAERDGRAAADSYVLIVVELASVRTGNDLESSLRALDVAHAMRTVFAGDETISRLTTRRFAALVDRDRADDTAIRLLDLLVAQAIDDGTHHRLWIEQLPRTSDGLAALLATLSA